MCRLLRDPPDLRSSLFPSTPPLSILTSRLISAFGYAVVGARFHGAARSTGASAIHTYVTARNNEITSIN